MPTRNSLLLAGERHLEARALGQVDLPDAVPLHVLDAHRAEERHVHEGEAVERPARRHLGLDRAAREALRAHQALREEVLAAVLAARADHLGRGGGIVGHGEVPGFHRDAKADVGHGGRGEWHEGAREVSSEPHDLPGVARCPRDTRIHGVCAGVRGRPRALVRPRGLRAAARRRRLLPRPRPRDRRTGPGARLRDGPRAAADRPRRSRVRRARRITRDAGVAARQGAAAEPASGRRRRCRTSISAPSASAWSSRPSGRSSTSTRSRTSSPVSAACAATSPRTASSRSTSSSPPSRASRATRSPSTRRIASATATTRSCAWRACGATSRPRRRT